MATYSVKGADSLIVKLEHMKNVSLKDGLEKACLIVEADAKTNCPVDTGALRASITHEVEDRTGIVGTNIKYAPYVEFGTGIFAAKGNGRQTPWVYQDTSGNWHYTAGQDPQPFLEPALIDNEKQIIQVIKEEYKKEIAKHA